MYSMRVAGWSGGWANLRCWVVCVKRVVKAAAQFEIQGSRGISKFRCAFLRTHLKAKSTSGRRVAAQIFVGAAPQIFLGAAPYHANTACHQALIKAQHRCHVSSFCHEPLRWVRSPDQARESNPGLQHEVDAQPLSYSSQLKNVLSEGLLGPNSLSPHCSAVLFWSAGLHLPPTTLSSWESLCLPCRHHQ